MMQSEIPCQWQIIFKPHGRMGCLGGSHLANQCLPVNILHVLATMREEKRKLIYLSEKGCGGYIVSVGKFYGIKMIVAFAGTPSAFLVVEQLNSGSLILTIYVDFGQFNSEDAFFSCSLCLRVTFMGLQYFMYYSSPFSAGILLLFIYMFFICLSFKGSLYILYATLYWVCDLQTFSPIASILLNEPVKSF